ncbi:MAG: hypothetical protein Q9209_007339 [Squamulea sp. 1 TL-2023]
MFALIDSTVPHIWLPTFACEAFEDAFGIQYDPITNLYLVNDDQHNAMIKQAAEVTFQLGTSLSGGDSISIKLPYASFDLETGPPFVKSQRKYFPLRRAKDETQFTLGRAFLQEAFSVFQAQYTQGQPSHIVVTSADATNNTTTTDSTQDRPPLTKTSSQKSGGIGTGAIAGIAVAVIILVLLAVVYCVWRLKFKKSRKIKDNTKGKAELEDNTEPKHIYENFNKRPPSEETPHEPNKGGKIKVSEVAQPPLAAELEGGAPSGGLSNKSMSMEHNDRAELPSPDPFRPELESPGFGLIRSELSTPEPPSELSTSDRDLVPELTSGEIPQELSSSNRNSDVRPYNNSFDSDGISPQDSSSLRPNHERKGSDDTIPTSASAARQRPSYLIGLHRHSNRPPHVRSSSSHDTFQTRMDEMQSTAPGANTPSLAHTHPMELYGAKSNSFRHAQGSPSPLASPRMGSGSSPSPSAFSSPTLPSSIQRLADNGPPTPSHLDLSSTSAEREPLMNQSQQPGSRNTRFAENFPSDPEMMSEEERVRERQKREEADGGLVGTEVENSGDRSRKGGK